MFQRIKFFFVNHVWWPFRKIRLAFAVKRKMQAKINSSYMDGYEDAQDDLISMQQQFHLDRLADENTYLKSQISKAIKLGFNPDTVPDSELL